MSFRVTHKLPPSHVHLPYLCASWPRRIRCRTYIRSHHHEDIILDLRDTQGVVRRCELMHSGLSVGERVYLEDRGGSDGSAEHGAIGADREVFDPSYVWKGPHDADGTVIWNGQGGGER